jgi:hypothetical protein
MTALRRFWPTSVLVIVLVGLAGTSGLAAAPPDGQTQSGTTSRLPPDKQAVLDGEATQIAMARNAPQPPKGGLGAPPDVIPTPGHPVSVPRFAAGQGTIVETGWSPVSKAYEFENQWGEESRSEALAVYAGAVRHDPSQGIVVVLMAKIRTGKDGYYPTSTRAGSVRVVGAVGERLRLMATSGAQFVFDVPTRQYVSP